MAAFAKFLSHKLHPPTDPTTSFASKTIIITGANTGLGLHAALKLAQLGTDHLILAVRDLSKGEAAKLQIQSSLSPQSTTTISVWHLDMLSYTSILSFASRAQSELSRLDCAVLNAGVFASSYRCSEYGWETDLQVNVLSTVLLGLLLLPKLRASRTGSDTPVLEFVSSGTHRRVTLDKRVRDSETPMGVLNEIASEGKYVANRQYGSSKLFLMCALPHLVSLANGKDGAPDVHVVSVCPGACMSDLARDMFVGAWWRSIVMFFVGFLLRTAEQGSRTLVSGLTLGAKGHGGFWQHDELQP